MHLGVVGATRAMGGSRSVMRLGVKIVLVFVVVSMMVRVRIAGDFFVATTIEATAISHIPLTHLSISHVPCMHLLSMHLLSMCLPSMRLPSMRLPRMRLPSLRLLGLHLRGLHITGTHASLLHLSLRSIPSIPLLRVVLANCITLLLATPLLLPHDASLAHPPSRFWVPSNLILKGLFIYDAHTPWHVFEADLWLLEVLLDVCGKRLCRWKLLELV